MPDPRLHPELIAFWGDMTQWPTFATMQDERAFWQAWCVKRGKPRPPGMAVHDGAIPGPGGAVPIRVYRPAAVATSDAPCLIHHQGGGFVSGSLDSADNVAWHMAEEARLVVISVQYRLAPEHPFPAAFDDAYAVAAAVAADAAAFGVDSAHIAVGGDSAGANLSAAVALAARDRGGPRLAGQLLIYGAFGCDGPVASRTANTGDPALSENAMAGYRRAYFGPTMTTDSPYGAPAKAASHAGLPPAFVVAAACDPLLDDSGAYAATLRRSGVPAELWVAPGMGHSFLRAWGHGPATDAACARVAAFARRACSA
ncbi:MAG: alpha/beta hydrolase [Alphaproteobacteria bacterium]